MLRKILFEIGSTYHEEKQQLFSNNLLVKYITKSSKDINQLLPDELKKTFISKSSAGQGQWADVPWIAFFYPLITQAAMKGYYVVYLFHATKRIIYLSLNQAATSVFNEFGASQFAFKVLKERSQLMRKRIQSFHLDEMIDQIELGSNSKLPRAYEAGHVLGFKYSTDTLPSEEILLSNLAYLCKTYIALAFNNGFDSFIESDNKFYDLKEIENNISIIEEKRYQYHRRIERNPNVSKFIKNIENPSCQVCGFNFKKFYGEYGTGYIEAHHILPLHALNEGTPIEYKRSDFALLCANCHRMLHRKKQRIDLKTLCNIVTNHN